jgi:hypothetical protein
MKTSICFSVLLALAAIFLPVSSSSQKWEGVGDDWTPGDCRVPLCILEKDGYIFFGDDHVGTFRFDTITNTWTHHPNPGMNVIFDMVVFDNKIWITSDGNGVFSSEDYGDTWQDRTAGLTHHKVYALTVCENVLFCGTYHGGVFRYDNGTGMWAAVNNGFPYQLNQWYVIELQTIGATVYMASMGIGLFKSSTLGEDWESMNYIQYDGGAEVEDFVKHGNYLMVPAYYQGVLRSIDDGGTWDFCNNGIASGDYVNCMAQTETAVFAGVRKNGIYMSKDHGDSWINANLGLPWDYQMDSYASIRSLEVIGEYLYAGIWFNGLWRAKLSDLYAGLLDVEENTALITPNLYQNQPNPFKVDTEIRYNLVDDGWVTLKIYDVFGKERATLVDCRQTPGEYAFGFNPKSVGISSCGIYYYRMKVGDAVQTRKMILVE